MKRMIILKGKANTGKTTKINEIFRWINNDYQGEIILGTAPKTDSEDVFGILTVGNLCIGINSRGDNEAEIRRTDELIKSVHSPDIIICSCRTKGVTWQHMNSKYNESTNWVRHIMRMKNYLQAEAKGRDDRAVEKMKTLLVGLKKQ